MTQACWRIVSGPESLGQYAPDSRSSLAIWTADRSGTMKSGDVVVMYRTRDLLSYVAIARVCSTPRQNDRVHHRIKNREWWVYLDVQPLRTPLPGKTVAALELVKSQDGSGLKTPAGSRANRVSGAAMEAFVSLLRNSDARAADRMERWLDGRGRYPAGLDDEELRKASWSPDEREEAAERKLSRQIAKRLVRRRGIRYPTSEDGVVDRVAGDDPTRLCLEVPIRDAAGRGYIDVLLVDERGTEPRLLLIEVKLSATLAPGRNPLHRLARYTPALREAVGAGWPIDRIAVAVSFNAHIEDELAAESVPAILCEPGSGRLRSSLPVAT